MLKVVYSPLRAALVTNLNNKKSAVTGAFFIAEAKEEVRQWLLGGGV